MPKPFLNFGCQQIAFMKAIADGVSLAFTLVFAEVKKNSFLLQSLFSFGQFDAAVGTLVKGLERSIDSNSFVDDGPVYVVKQLLPVDVFEVDHDSDLKSLL